MITAAHCKLKFRLTHYDKANFHGVNVTCKKQLPTKESCLLAIRVASESTKMVLLQSSTVFVINLSCLPSLLYKLKVMKFK